MKTTAEKLFFLALAVFLALSYFFVAVFCSFRSDLEKINLKLETMNSNIVEMQKPFWEKLGK